MDYRALQSTALKAINKFGFSCRLTRNGSRYATTVGVFVATKSSNESQSASSVAANTAMTKRTMYLSGAIPAPQVGDYVEAGITYRIQTIEAVNPAGLPLLYKVEVV